MGWLVAALGAILLLVSLFLDWFEPGLDGWTVFEALDLLLAAAALAVLAVAARSFGFATLPETAGVAAAVVAFIVVVSQLIDHPPAATELDVDVGGWLGLAGATLMLLGAVMSRAGVSLAVVREDSPQPGTAPGARASPAPGPADGETVPMRPDQQQL